jgi:hypothetical protein
VTGFETARTVRYAGQDPEEIRRSYAADSERALAAGFVVTRSRWDTSGGPPVLVVDYVHASFDRPKSAPPATADPSRARTATQAPSRGGLGEALLIVGLILAVIVALAVTIPSSPPAAAPAPSVAPALVPVGSTAPDSPGPASSAPLPSAPSAPDTSTPSAGG